jgi:UDP:flavonoid glycosyltransferase YjiC (YdhE family)
LTFGTTIEIKHTEEKFRHQPVHFLSKNYSEIAISHAAIAVQRSSLLLTTGHLETLYRAIRYKIPVLGIPQSEEESWYIKRILDLGIGIRLPSTLTTKSFTSVITKLIRNKSNLTLAANELAEAAARHNVQKEVGEIISTKGRSIP